MIDFNRKGLETILVDANTTRIDVGDSEIFLPNNRKMLKITSIFFIHILLPSYWSKNKSGNFI